MMNKDYLKAVVSNNLLKVWQKKVSHDAACGDICAAFRAYAKRNKDVDVEDIVCRVDEAVRHFLLDVDPGKPGVAIHDAIDHMFNG